MYPQPNPPPPPPTPSRLLAAGAYIEYVSAGRLRIQVPGMAMCVPKWSRVLMQLKAAGGASELAPRDFGEMQPLVESQAADPTLGRQHVWQWPTHDSRQRSQRRFAPRSGDVVLNLALSYGRLAADTKHQGPSESLH